MEDRVLRQVEELNRWFGGRIVPDTDPSDELLAPRSLLDPDVLRALITRAASSTSDRPPPGMTESPTEVGSGDLAQLNLRVAVSRFARHYAGSVTTLALVGLSRGIGIDLSLDRCTMVIKHNVPFSLTLDSLDNDVLGCDENLSPWQISGPRVDIVAELRNYVWRKLYAENLWPVLDLAIKIGKISPGVVWTNVAEWPVVLGRSAVEYLGKEAAQPFVSETDALLDAPNLPGVPAGTNPLADLHYEVPGDGKRVPRDNEQTEALLSHLSPQ